PLTHFIYLALAVNFSVFHYEILTSPDRRASRVQAKEAFDDTIAELDTLSDE
ncbi:hypothetical protein OH76DRAFT_1332561, partial [Lentinus brumalis]